MATIDSRYAGANDEPDAAEGAGADARPRRRGRASGRSVHQAPGGPGERQDHETRGEAHAHPLRVVEALEQRRHTAGADQPSEHAAESDRPVEAPGGLRRHRVVQEGEERGDHQRAVEIAVEIEAPHRRPPPAQPAARRRAHAPRGRRRSPPSRGARAGAGARARRRRALPARATPTFATLASSSAWAAVRWIAATVSPASS